MDTPTCEHIKKNPNIKQLVAYVRDYDLSGYQHFTHKYLCIDCWKKHKLKGLLMPINNNILEE